MISVIILLAPVFLVFKLLRKIQNDLFPYVHVAATRWFRVDPITVVVILIIERVYVECDRCRTKTRVTREPQNKHIESSMTNDVNDTSFAFCVQ